MSRFIVIRDPKYNRDRFYLNPSIFDTLEEANLFSSKWDNTKVYDLEWTVEKQQQLANKLAETLNTVNEIKGQLKLYQS